MFVCDAVHTVSAENIPRTLQSVYQRARTIFDPKFATEGWVVNLVVIILVVIILYILSNKSHSEMQLEQFEQSQSDLSFSCANKISMLFCHSISLYRFTSLLRVSILCVFVSYCIPKCEHGGMDLIGLKPYLWNLSSFSALTLLVGSFDP